MEGLEYTLALRDQMSGPAHQVRDALGGVSKSIKELDERIEKASFKELKGSLFPSVVAGELAADAIREVGRSVLEAGKEIVKFTIEAAEFKADTIDAFEAMGASGTELFSDLSAMARNIHAPVDKAVGLAQELMAMGMQRADHIQATIGAVTALERVGLQQGAVKVRRIVEESLAEGFFKLPKKLAGTGINLDSLNADLAKRLGTTVDVVKTQLKAGKIAADVGIAAVADAINAGKIGQIAARKFDITDAITDLKNNFRSLVEDVDLSPLMQGIGDFVSMFDSGSESGKTLKAVMKDALNTTIQWLGKGVEAATLFAIYTETAFIRAEIALAPLIKGVQKLSDLWNSMANSGFVKGFAALTQERANRFTPEEVAEMKAAMHPGQVATEMTGMEADLYKASKSLGESAVKGAKDAVGAHSPARKLIDLGHSIGEGLEIGMEQSGMGTSMAGMVRPPSVSPSGPSAARGTPSVTIDVGGIHLHADGHLSHPEEWMPLIESQVVDLFGRVALELGQ